MASGTIVKNVVEYIVNQIVEDTKSVKVDVADSDDENVTIEVRTSPDDMGRVIGKRGRVARAIRTVAQAAADEGHRIPRDRDGSGRRHGCAHISSNSSGGPEGGG